MRPDEIEIIRRVVQARSGLVIDPDKTYRVETCLGPVARREGFADISEMIRDIQAKRDNALMWAVTEALANTCLLYTSPSPRDS